MAGLMTAQATRVVLVEDHPVMRAGIRTALERVADIEIVGEAATGAQALALVRDVDVDVVLLDIGLPDVDGLALLPELKAAAGRAEVVMLSCRSDDVCVRLAMSGGASGYLTKSAGPDEIVDAVRRVRRGEAPMSMEAASHIVSVTRAMRPGDELDLTAREREVWRAVANGLSNAEIARTLFISVSTAKFHVHNLLRKLGLRSRSEAICAARRASPSRRTA
jgi:DNA-binding NarL/FixJ family response regulator